MYYLLVDLVRVPIFESEPDTNNTAEYRAEYRAEFGYYSLHLYLRNVEKRKHKSEHCKKRIFSVLETVVKMIAGH